MHRRLAGLAAVWLAVATPSATAQSTTVQSTAAQSTLGTRNVTLEARLPLGGSSGPLWLDQDPARPFVYVARQTDVAVVSVEQPGRPEVAGTVAISSTPTAVAGLVTTAGRPLLAVGHAEGIEWFDMLDPRTPVRAGRSALPAVNALFAYAASDDRRVLFAAAGEEVVVFDADAPADPIQRISLPEGARGRTRSIESVYAAYEMDSATDRLYTSGTGGHAVYDVTGWGPARLLTFVQPAIVQLATRAQATPDGTHLVTTAGYETAPVRLFDLRPAFDGTTSTVRTDTGAWTADWKGYARDLQLRWPYLFVASGPAGFHLVNVRNPLDPFTAASWRTWDGPGDDAPGAVSVDVRDRDGLVAVSDARTGLWLLRIDEFRGWDGRGWGVPDLGPAQRWGRSPLQADRW